MLPRPRPPLVGLTVSLSHGFSRPSEPVETGSTPADSGLSAETGLGLLPHALWSALSHLSQFHLHLSRYQERYLQPPWTGWAKKAQ
jgi:hypothetical protein